MPKSRKVSGNLSVVICGETIHSIGTPETIQVFENILSDLPDFEIRPLANKIRSANAIPGNPLDIKTATVRIAYFKYM